MSEAEKYKPLSDDEIESAQWEWIGAGYSETELRSLVAYKLSEQALRANRLAEAVERYLALPDAKAHGLAYELAYYLGQKED